MTTEVIEGEAVEETALAVREPVAVALVPDVSANDLVVRLGVIKDAMRDAMERDVDYGVIPGTGSKPTLLKPGAEKLAVLFQLDVEIENEKLWGDDGHLTVLSRAIVYHSPTGTRLGSGEGMCSTRESKYAYRNQDRVCPACGAEAIIKGKAEYGGGWLCFKKKGGCGAKYSDGEAVIESQAVGKVPNPDLADSWNTVTKMASKRARIDAVLAVTGASAIFTQDVEIEPQDTPSEATGAAQRAQQAQAKASAPLATDDEVAAYRETVIANGFQWEPASKALSSPPTKVEIERATAELADVLARMAEKATEAPA